MFKVQSSKEASSLHFRCCRTTRFKIGSERMSAKARRDKDAVWLDQIVNRPSGGRQDADQDDAGTVCFGDSNSPHVLKTLSFPEKKLKQVHSKERHRP